MFTQNVQLSTRERQFGKTSEYAHKRCNSQHGIESFARLPIVNTRCPTLNTGLEYGKTSEYTHKRCNSPHGKGNLARSPNMHLRGATVNTE
ncbi:hypothetical protein PoB_002417200 [Plakobranchus ocellatus]|uniref:Uncharacterized protein n=1 Tax=Plakobranchus ocellatus TaxID=259542 RepID=A0AAV3ZR77_9GAST|nr:hypothetical protein PoB_002417200 [Plakobranchus ocellatus]